MICELCGSIHAGVYGSGRFCTSKCARSFSSRLDRANTNLKIQAKAKQQGAARKKPTALLTCRYCNNQFTVTFNRRTQIHCSKSCASHDVSPETRNVQSVKRIAALLEGRVRSSAIRCVYTRENGSVINCDSKLEFTCLNWFETNHTVLDIQRCTAVLQYLLQGNKHRYVPDFIITTIYGTYIVECKSTFFPAWMSTCADRYMLSAPLKKEALERYAEQSFLIPFWFQKEMHLKFYRTLRVPEEMFQSDKERIRLESGIAAYETKKKKT